MWLPYIWAIREVVLAKPATKLASLTRPALPDYETLSVSKTNFRDTATRSHLFSGHLLRQQVIIGRPDIVIVPSSNPPIRVNYRIGESWV